MIKLRSSTHTPNLCKLEMYINNTNTVILNHDTLLVYITTTVIDKPLGWTFTFMPMTTSICL